MPQCRRMRYTVDCINMKNFNQPLTQNPFAAKSGRPEAPKTPGVQPELDPKLQTKRWENLTKGEIARLSELGADKLRFAPVHLPTTLGGKSLDSVRVGLMGMDPATAKEAYVHLWLNEDKKGETKLEFTIRADGTIMGRIPTALAGALTHEAVMREVLEQFESLKPESWYYLDEAVLPPGEGSSAGGGEGGGKKKKRPMPTEADPRRVAFYQEQPEAILRLTSKDRGGFRGYLVIFYPGFALLDNVAYENAAYIIDGTPDNLELPIGATEEEVQDAVKRLPVHSWLTRPKIELRRAGAARIQHKGDEWEKTLKEEIEKRLKKN